MPCVEVVASLLELSLIFAGGLVSFVIFLGPFFLYMIVPSLRLSCILMLKGREV
jgi:hypothetical protein